MTIEEKRQIAEMRKAGVGYKKIAQGLGLSESTVKTFCHRNGLAGIPAESMKDPPSNTPQKPCQCCGEMIPQILGRKEKKFCSDGCRNRWWNKHLGEVKRRGMLDYTCPTCGKTFSAYGKRNRKYCSHGCYIADRFGGAPCR